MPEGSGFDPHQSPAVLVVNGLTAKIKKEREMIKRILAAMGVALITTGAWAQCSSHTIFANGRTIICTTCCYGGNCTTNCF